MSRGASISIYGLYMWDHTLFDDMIIPETIDKEILVENIITTLEPLPVIYPDASFMKLAIRSWSTKEVHNWIKLNDALTIDYEPLENYNRLEDWTDYGTNSQKFNNAETGSSSQSGNSTTTNNSEGSNKDFSTGYNDLTLNATGSSSTSGSGKAELVHSTNDKTQNESTGTNTGSQNNIHSGRVHGNIGVTTSQQMLQSEVDLRTNTNIYDIITEEFKNRFCIMVY